MSVCQLFKLVLAVLMTIGLTVAPLAAPAAARQLVTADMDEMANADMTADMPCCLGQRDQQDQKARDCAFCPFVALCMFNLVVPAPDAAGLVDREFSRNAFALPDDPLIDGLGEHPPDHPPRMTV